MEGETDKQTERRERPRTRHWQGGEREDRGESSGEGASAAAWQQPQAEGATAQHGTTRSRGRTQGRWGVRRRAHRIRLPEERGEVAQHGSPVRLQAAAHRLCQLLRAGQWRAWLHALLLRAQLHNSCSRLVSARCPRGCSGGRHVPARTAGSSAGRAADRQPRPASGCPAFQLAPQPVGAARLSRPANAASERLRGGGDGGGLAALAARAESTAVRERRGLGLWRLILRAQPLVLLLLMRMQPC